MESAEDRAARRWDHPAPKVCRDCALSTSARCRWHRGETPWLPEPPKIDPAFAVELRRDIAASNRRRDRKAWAWAALILAASFALVLLGAIR